MTLLVATQPITPSLRDDSSSTSPTTSAAFSTTTLESSTTSQNSTASETVSTTEATTPATETSVTTNASQTPDSSGTASTSETNSTVTSTSTISDTMAITNNTSSGTTPFHNARGDSATATTESDITTKSGDSQTIIIIVSAAAVSGVLVGIVTTVIVVITCRRKSHENKTAKRPSYKRTFSYSLSNESENTTKAEPAYIQILPDPVGSSDDGGDEKLELENLENASHERDTDKFKSEEDDYDVVVDELKPDQVKHYGDVNDALGITTSKCKDEEDGYDIVDEEVKQKVAQVNKENNTNRNDKRQKKTEDNYSHIKTDGRKISDTNINYSHVSLDDLYANKRISKPDNLLMETTIPMKENNTDDGYYSNLDVSIHNALQAMDKTIADFDNNETLSDRSECSDDDIEEETYNRLGSLKKKSEYGQNKFNYGQKQKRHRSRSLPADDLKPQFKAICDEVDTYDHLRKTEADGDNAHTYINWTPPRHVKSKSLPENQNLEYVKGIRKDADNYSHINLMETTPKRKIAVATMNPAHLVEDTKVSYNQILPEPNGYDFSVINRVNKQKGAKVNGNEKMAVFTLKEGESEDAQPHTYFILEPSTAL